MFLFDGPETASHTILLAHGAGAPMDSATMTALANTLAANGFRVARFEFAYMAGRRQGLSRRPPPKVEQLMAAYCAAVEALDSKAPLIISGKSMGGRIASMVADRLYGEGRISGLLCLGYPFHPPAKTDSLRIDHLRELAVPTLICQGSRDPFGTDAEVSTYRLSPQISWLWLADGDHDFVPRKSQTLQTAGDHIAAIGGAARIWADQTLAHGASPSA